MVLFATSRIVDMSQPKERMQRFAHLAVKTPNANLESEARPGFITCEASFAGNEAG
jgi:hypothetical protein